MDYTTTGNNDCDEKPTYNSSPARNSDTTSNELLLNISSAIKSALTSVQKKKHNSKRLYQGAINKLETTHDAASSLIALVNQMRSTNFQELEEMHEHLQKNLKLLKSNKKTCLNLQNWTQILARLRPNPILTKNPIHNLTRF
jgi:hypothetical protein